MRPMTESCRARVRARRRLVVTLGLSMVALLTATACIFDRSDYQGGGRDDKGATAKTEGSATATGSSSATSTSTATSTPDSGIPDVFAGGD